MREKGVKKYLAVACEMVVVIFSLSFSTLPLLPLILLLYRERLHLFRSTLLYEEIKEN